MIIKCPRCSTRYKIDDSTLTEKGSYARCSSCENVFFVRKRPKDEIERIRENADRDEGASVKAADVATEQKGEETLAEPEEAAPVPAAEQEAGPAPVLENVSEEPAISEPGPSSFGQDDIDALLAANAPKSDEAPEAEPEASLFGQDDIDALLAANAPKSDESPEMEPEPSLFGQDDIDALLAANAPKTDESPEMEPEPSLFGQDDIDALLAANAPKTNATPEAEPEASLFGQDDIDALLAAAKSGGVSDSGSSESVEKEMEGDLISQDDIDALLSADEPEEEAVPEERSGGTDQDGVDSLLAEIGAGVEPEQEEAGIEASEERMEGDLISQDDIDALLAEANHETSGHEEPEEEEELVIEHAAEEEALFPEDELDQLLSSGEDEVGDDLFKQGIEEEEEGLEQAIPEIAEEETEEEEAEPEDILGIPSATAFSEMADKDAPIIPEEEDETLEAGRATVLSGILGRIKRIFSKIPFPSFRIPALSPRLRMAVVGGAVVIVMTIAGGGYWFFFGGKGVAPVEMEAKAPDVTAEALQAAEAPVPAAAGKEADSLVADMGTGGEPVLPLGVYLPVEFDREATRIMNVDVELVFDTDEVKDAFAKRKFYAAVTVEQTIDSFFENKFYEDTIFVQDKLEEYMDQSLKSMKQFAGLKQVRLASLTFE